MKWNIERNDLLRGRIGNVYSTSPEIELKYREKLKKKLTNRYIVAIMSSNDI